MANKFFITAILLIFTSALAVGLSISCDMEWTLPWFIIVAFASVLAILCFVLGIVYFVISTQRTSGHNTILSALHHFILKYYVLYIGTRMLRRFRESCKNPRKVQEDLLRQIIKMNKNTDYGRQFQLGNIDSLDDLRNKHPITDYNHYVTFVTKIAKGEKNVLTTKRITRLVMTSGTTGKRKLIPQDEYYPIRAMALGEALQHEMFPDLQPMQTKFHIHCNSRIDKSECGISKASLTAFEPHMVRNMVVYSTPPHGFLIENCDEATYVHLLFALRDKNLGSIFVTFSSLFLETMKHLEANWKNLVDDLARGTLKPELKLAPHIRSSLTKALGCGDAQRANEVQRECEKGFDGILKRLWPHLHLISTIDNVGIRDRLKQSVAAGLKICSPMYVCSEALLGLNLCSFVKEEDDYVLNVADNVFEFVPEDEMNNPKAQTLLVDEVEIGQNYELLFTQFHGLYRYRFGDVINVSGFYKNCPKIKFLYRKATLLDLVGEKVDQTVIHESLKEALNPWADAVELSYYSVAENTLRNDFFGENEASSVEGNKTSLFYVFFLELTPTSGGDLPSVLKPELLAKEIDKNLCKRHDIFNRVFNFTNKLGQSKIYFVKTGTFNKLKEFILTSTSAPPTQFKMPLKLRTEQMTDIMLENSLH